MVKKPPAKQETSIRSLGGEDPLEKGMATHSSTLAWRIPMDRGAWWATIHGVAKSRTRLSHFCVCVCVCDSLRNSQLQNEKCFVLNLGSGTLDLETCKDFLRLATSLGVCYTTIQC